MHYIAVTHFQFFRVGHFIAPQFQRRDNNLAMGECLMLVRARFHRLLFSGLFALGLMAPVLASAMTFELVPFGDSARCGQKCPLVIGATGEITNESPREFYDFLYKNIGDPRVRSIVFIHSPGGAVEASMRLGTMFRQTGVMAIVGRVLPAPSGLGPALNVPGARCFSACVYALMGAKRRVVPADALVGIHRMHFDRSERDRVTDRFESNRTFGSSQFVAQLANYANAMGVSRQLVYTAEKVDAERIHLLTSDELRKWRLGSRTYK